MASVELEKVSKRFGRTTIIQDVDLTLAEGELTVFVGPSGCGKSTLLRLIAGLEEVSAGRVRIGGRDVTALPPARRGVAMVFQSYALYPHMTAFQNMAFGLKLAHAGAAEIRRRVEEAARVLQIEALLPKLPRELSGGQRQRVAIGRAIVREPEVFLFDEPLSNLDAALRVQMRLEIAALQRRLQATMVYVTHDQVEAMTLGHTIVVLNQGRVEQVGAPLELYRSPRNRFVAGFIGSPAMNFIELAAGAALALPAAPPGAAALGIRPEHILLGAGPLHGEVSLVERLGGESLLHLRAGGIALTVRLAGNSGLAAGERVAFALAPEQLHWFGADGRAV